MNKASMINEVAKKTGINKNIVEDIVNSLLDEIIAQLKSGNQVTFAGFGTFSAKERHARMGVNPLNPKEKIQMPATIVPKFKAGKTLKDALKPTENTNNLNANNPLLEDASSQESLDEEDQE